MSTPIRLLVGMLVTAALLLAVSATALAAGQQEVTPEDDPAETELIINSNRSDPEPRRVFAEVVEMYEERNPDVSVTVNTFSHEDYKTLLRTWLGSARAPDVVTWFAGERMRFFAERDLLEPLDSLLGGGAFTDYFPASFESAAMAGDSYYFLPETWYWWGVYYRPSVFEEHGVDIPETWDEFMDAIATFKDADMIPIAIGTRYLWTTGGWFDYLNMRINGMEFHQELTAGEVPYTDSRVRAVFEKWAELVEAGAFMDDHSAYAWQEAATPLFEGDAAMYLMGQFIFDTAPDEVQDDLDFFRFPVIDPSIGLYEDTPIDGFMIPEKARNKEAAMDFIEFLASEEIQRYQAEELGRLAANVNVEPPDDHARKGFEMVQASDGVMQFFDRDADEEFANRAMNSFVEFMTFPDRLDDILEELEQERQRMQQ